MSSPVLCDLTSLIKFCYGSGVQRVTREVLRHWPDPDELMPCAFDAEGRLRLLSRAVLPILCPAEGPSATDIEEERRALAALEAQSSDLPEAAPRRLLNVEPFYEEIEPTRISVSQVRAGRRGSWSTTSSPGCTLNSIQTG